MSLGIDSFEEATAAKHEFTGSKQRRTPLSARGEPTVWLMGASLSTALLMITGLLVVIAYSGLSSFWPKAIDRVELRNGEAFFGQFVREETFTPGDAPDEERERSLYRVGNRDTGQTTFRWVEEPEVVSRSNPQWAVQVERLAWGSWLGEPVQVEQVDASGQIEVIAQGPAETVAALKQLIPQAADRRDQVTRLQRGVIDRSNRERERWRLKVATAERELELQRTPRSSLGVLPWVMLLAGAGAAVGIALRSRRSWAISGGWCLAILLVIAALVEQPWGARAITEQEVITLREQAEAASNRLTERTRGAEQEIVNLQAENDRVRVRIVDPLTGMAAPVSRSSPDEPLRVAQIVRVVPANTLSLPERVSVLLSRWFEFLTTDPREANTEGGVWPVIFGTVVLTLLLSLAVMPLGVVAAIYLREYAKQGLVTSILRIAINNLAGVPSIVYGVFGLGFFCYTVGGYVDSGPADPLPRAPWWFLAGGLVVVIATAAGLASTAKRASLAGEHSFAKRMLSVAGMGWLASVILIVVLASTTPYFDGFFAAKSAENIPTFRSKGVLWASLTLALLTLPVVIVATEEAIAAVPGSSREGSYGCGASRWQTTQRVVLPGAMPGIMTGAILAMARGAGEVAPLMLVGAVKLSPELPVDSVPPFLHLDRPFMHLGFHIFDLGYQSPDPEASKPLVWATTLLLVLIVFAMNSAAMLIRAHLRRKLSGPVV